MGDWFCTKVKDKTIRFFDMSWWFCVMVGEMNKVLILRNASFNRQKTLFFFLFPNLSTNNFHLLKTNLITLRYEVSLYGF